METPFKEGDYVYARVNPQLKLKIRRHIPSIFYCTVVDDPTAKELVYFTRELMTTGERDTLLAAGKSL